MTSLQAPPRDVFEALCRAKGPKCNVLAYDEQIWIKYGSGVTLGEAAMRQYVHENADARIVRIPRVLDAFSTTSSRGKPMTCIVMEHVKGDNYITHSRQHPEDADRVLEAVAKAVRHIWDIPIPPDALPGPLEREEPEDRFFSDSGAQRVFNDLVEVENWINDKVEEAGYPDRVRLQGEPLQICHCDLTQFNVKIGQPITVLDWGYSGIYPRAFEEFALFHQFNLEGLKFAKALHGLLFGPRLSKAMRPLSIAARFLQ